MSAGILIAAVGGQAHVRMPLSGQHDEPRLARLERCGGGLGGDGGGEGARQPAGREGVLVVKRGRRDFLAAFCSENRGIQSQSISDIACFQAVYTIPKSNTYRCTAHCNGSRPPQPSCPSSCAILEGRRLSS